MGRNYSLQALRAIAAVLVVFAHTITQINMASEINGYLGYVLKTIESLGGLGVYIFFIISGYIMSYTTCDKKGGRQEAISFLKKRFLRVYPVYWICLSIMTIGWAGGIFLKSHDYSIYKVIASYLLLPFSDPYSGNINPILSQGWTLMYEIFFYFSFSVLLYLDVKGLKKVYYLFGFYFCVYFLGRFNFFPWISLNLFLQKPSFFLFILGMIFFECQDVFRHLFHNYLLRLFIVVICIFLLFYVFDPNCSMKPDFIMYPLSALIFLLFNSCNINNRTLNLLGDSSYSIYLTHGFIVLLFGNIIKRLDVNYNYALLFSSLPFIFTIMIGVYFYKYVETKVIYKSKLIFS
ncbi:acyltransferase [Escherichia coli]|nr:acyltransferase [Escherichia coli]